MIVSPAPYLPFADPIHRRVPGLVPLDPATWTERDAAFAPQMAYRDRLIEERADRVALALPQAADAIREMADMLRDHVERTDGYTRTGEAIMRPDGVWVPLADDIATLGRLCQEDWLILQDTGVDEYVLTAGNLCFPTGWNLRDKIGHPLTHIHGPVPGYADTLAARVNRIFAALHADRPLMRLNWSVAGTPELHCPSHREHHAEGTARYLRTERQTLRRLPRTRAVVFGVKVAVTPVDDLDPAARTALREAIAALPPDMADYKGGLAFLARN